MTVGSPVGGPEEKEQTQNLLEVSLALDGAAGNGHKPRGHTCHNQPRVFCDVKISTEKNKEKREHGKRRS